MDVIGLLLLLLMGVIISTSSGGRSSNGNTEGLESGGGPGFYALDSFEDGTLPDAQGLSVPHISNQHPGLRKLSEAKGHASPAAAAGGTNPGRHRSGVHRIPNEHDTDDDLPSLPSSETDLMPEAIDHEASEPDGSSNSASYNGAPSAPRLQGSAAFLRRVMLKNASVTCNDGTTAGYYMRLSASNSRRWLVFLEGGWHCFSTVSCHQRWLRMRSLMTSAHWPEMRSGQCLSSLFLSSLSFLSTFPPLTNPLLSSLVFLLPFFLVPSFLEIKLKICSFLLLSSFSNSGRHHVP